MSKRANAQVSLKLDSSPKQKSGPLSTRKDRYYSPCTFVSRLIPLNRSNIFAFFLGFIASSFVYMSTWTDLTSSFSSANRTQARPAQIGKTAAIVVPFRDRFDELEYFIPHMSTYLASKSIQHHIYIVNQVDSLRFNRAALINVGFLVSARTADYMIMHDIDLLPLNERLDYSYPPASGPNHVSASGLHPEYDYSTFIGGILSIRKEHFIRTNGMSNRYWGWGKEDDEFALRLKEANFTVNRPNRLSAQFLSGRKYTFKDLHGERRHRDKKKFPKQKQEALKRDNTGLSNLQYRIESMRQLTFLGQFSCTVVDVVLFCNRLDTHWCTTDYQFYD